MPQTPGQGVVYRRVNANTGTAWLLLVGVPLAFLPVVSAGTVLLMHMTGATLAVSVAASALAVTLAIGCPTALFGSRIVLLVTDARPLRAGEEQQLVRTVENLCVGTGLPVPRLHLIESAAPNAFATGSSPRDAALVVTRGLLTLLERRELEGVIAHELSHIGNHDIRLTTPLVALVGIATLPIRSCETAVRLAYKYAWGYRDIIAMSAANIAPMACIAWLIGLTVFVFRSLQWLLFGTSWEALADAIPHFLLGLSVMGAAFHVLFVSPLLALSIRRAVSQEFAFLADADAVRLTLDPDGLALALMKIFAADATPLDVGEGCAHLCLVDPLARDPSVLHEIFPSHPPLGERIDLLARMGHGITPSAIEAAWKSTGVAHQTPVEPIVPEPIVPDAAPAPTAQPNPRLEPDFVVSSDPLTALYERPDGWSRVLARLPENAEITIVSSDGHFTRVVTKDNVAGYVSSSARLSGLAS